MTGKKKLINLVKEYGFETESEYFQYIDDSIANGQRSQAKDLFLKMRKQDQKDFLNSGEIIEKSFFINLI